MLRPPAPLDLRKHPRALLHLPVRIRWHGPLGTRLETTHTIDVSREGLLVQRAEPCEVDTRIWVAFPYEPQEGASVQPETPATVVRVKRDAAGGFQVALHLEVPPRGPSWPTVKERRKHPRFPFALPIFVRRVGAAWPEESMTCDISRSGVRFETSLIYTVGEEVLAKVPWGEWAKIPEISGRVVRVDAVEDRPGSGRLSNPNGDPSAIVACVAAEWTPSAADYLRG